MEKDRNYLIEAYNATSTDDPPGSDQIETYEAWLERQLISRINKIEVLEAKISTLTERMLAAEEYIEEIPCDPDITSDQYSAYLKWQGLKDVVPPKSDTQIVAEYNALHFPHHSMMSMTQMTPEEFREKYPHIAMLFESKPKPYDTPGGQGAKTEMGENI